VDLAAGTGLFTRTLLDRVPQITSVEPDGRMRAVLAERTGGVCVLDGRGEAIPLPDSSVDAVFVSTAWHWFDPALAIPEIARVLRDGGRLGVIWTSRDRADDWVAELDLLRLSGCAGGGPRLGGWRAAHRGPGAGEAGPSSLGNPAAGRALRTRGGRVVHVHPDHGRR
jgi:ubiquinone/menaquinone biosynthesis C-methylase UbiE